MKTINKNSINIMKKLNVSQMENLQGGTNGRNCMLLGAAAVLSLGLGPIATIGWGAAAGLAGGALITGMSGDCF